ncbi:hypothetical protein P5P86_19110 [Nocardioides sp. BP30]|uniref:hypothetical protein n=1 Tax=Nocardioides sp. BP30 TaxID=3036374 RepID=UPI002468D5E6|nr:hypothetical protein [Nocardioides sp. BP30]WGL52047.1 hypothetical protein P5P86_19110 [Nocardioides sp. BP30]
MVNFAFRPFRVLLAVVATGVLVGAFALLSMPAQAGQGPHLTLKASSHRITTSGRVALTAHATHRGSATGVVLEQKKSSGWKEVDAFPRAAGGRVTESHLPQGTIRYRAVLEDAADSVLAVSPVVTIHVTAPAKASGSSQPASHSCTRTSSGSCIQGGEFCKQSMYGQVGYDASGRSWECTGDHTHPHWE